MTKTVTARFEDEAAARNAHEDLIDTGFPAESVYLDTDKSEVKVMASTDAEREVHEILGRHAPSEVTEHAT